MTKAGLGRHIQWQICDIVRRYATQNTPCTIGRIHASLYPGRAPYNPQLSSLRVTLSWLVRQGRLRRQRVGRYSSFYPEYSTRNGQEE